VFEQTRLIIKWFWKPERSGVVSEV
jgi:hypothetical protein